MATIRQRLICLTVIVPLLSFQLDKASAQGPAGAPTAAPALPANVVKVSRPYYVEGAVVVLLMAAAVFAVVRSSRRV